MINIKELSKWYNQQQVIKDVSMNISHGETVVIVGPSGSGKSTLLRCINGLEDFQEGSVNIKGKEEGTASRPPRISMVFQHFNLFPHKTVLENLTLAPVKVLKMSKEKAEAQSRELLQKVGLIDKINCYPSKLSGGQKQRVAIARALAIEPDIMLFDEPTSALDAEMVSEVLDVIKGLVNNTKTLIIVTHEMTFAKNIADRIIFMDDGQLLEDLSPHHFFTAPSNPRTRNFLNKILK